MTSLTSSRHSWHILPGIIGLGIMLALILFVSGCTHPVATQVPPTHVTTTISGSTDVTKTLVKGGKNMVNFIEADNGTTGIITQTTQFAVKLNENPTTGYLWNVTLSPGLALQSSDYQVDGATTGRVGVGGVHTWVIIAKDPGMQNFSASYRHSWEPVTDNERNYTVNIVVEKN